MKATVSISIADVDEAALSAILALLNPQDIQVVPEPEEEEPERSTVREFDPIEVRARHLPVLQRLKKGKATAKQLAAKLPGHWTQQDVSNSLGYLKRYGLVERQVGSRYWVTTPKANAHLLVAA